MSARIRDMDKKDGWMDGILTFGLNEHNELMLGYYNMYKAGPSNQNPLMAVKAQQQLEEEPVIIEEKPKLPKNIIGTTADELRNAQDQGTSDSDTSLLTTAPFDARFPNTNQTRACWQHYIDFHKCARAKAEEGGPENAGCKKLQRLARIMCPGSWIEKWDSALEQGINPSDMTPPTL